MINRRTFRSIGFILLLLTLVSAPISVVAAPSPSDQGAPPFVEGEVLLKLKPGVSPSAIARTVGATVERSIGDGSIQLLTVRGGSVSAAVKALSGRPGVVFAEPNWLRQLHDAPDDDGYYLKWDLNNDDSSLCDGSDCATADADMDWQEAYTLLGSNFSGSAVVAVIDTGIDFGHPDLNDKITTGRNFLDDGDPGDTYGHGTHVAGIVLAETNNGTSDGDIDTAGVGYSPNIQVMPLRVCDENGCPTSAIVDAIYHAANEGANVINLSLGGRFGSSSEEQAINYAWGKGLVISASSGNDGSGRVSYPAAFANCIAVGSTNWHDQLAPYSNKGGDLDVVAPGGDMSGYHDPGGIYSTMPTYDVYLTTAYEYDTYYDQLQGTSMAAPQVSGLAALLFAVVVTDADGDEKTNDEIRDIIESTADDLGKAGWDREYGWGRVNVNEAVVAASGGGDYPPSVTITNPNDGDTVSGNVTVTADASDDNGVKQVEFFVDGGSIGVDEVATDGWSADWDTNDYVDGPYTVSATATDTIDQTATDSVGVDVDNVDEPPSAAIFNPANDSTVSGMVTIQVDATDDRDAEGPLTVEVSIDTGDWTETSYNDSSGYYEQDWDTAGLTDGTHHTIDARAKDIGGNTTNATQVTVTVDNSEPTTMHVGDLDGSSTNEGRTWTAIVTITIHDASCSAVGGAVVSGSWSNGVTASCPKDSSSGQCFVRQERIPKRTGSVTFTVTDVTDTLTYDSAYNHDPEGDSDGTNITVYKP